VNANATRTGLALHPTKTSSPASSPNPTFAPSPTKTPTYIVGKVLFEDDFEDGDANGWRFIGKQNWDLVQESDGNYAMQVISPSFNTPLGMSTGDLGWSNYTFEIKVKLIEPPINSQYGVSLNVRYDFDQFDPPRSMYSIRFDERYGTGTIDRFKNNERIDIGHFSYSGLKIRTWHSIRIEVFNDQIKVFLDDEFMGEASDKFPLPPGLIGFAPEDNKDGQIVLFDNIHVVELLPNP
jgi:hypothetical protein